MRLVLCLLLMIAFSCKNIDKKIEAYKRSSDENLQLFDSLVNNSDQVKIWFWINPNQNEKGVYKLVKVLDDKQQIQHIKDFIGTETTTDSCGPSTGVFSFRKDSVEIKEIEFSFKLCPVFYLPANGKFIAYRMTYRGGMYLDNLSY